MFTIKHVAPDGREYLVECESFVRDERLDGFVQYTAWAETAPNPNGEYIMTWCGDERAGPIGAHRLFIMNRHGATVSSHTFLEPDFSKAQADPAKVAA